MDFFTSEDPDKVNMLMVYEREEQAR